MIATWKWQDSNKDCNLAKQLLLWLEISISSADRTLVETWRKVELRTKIYAHRVSQSSHIILRKIIFILAHQTTSSFWILFMRKYSNLTDLLNVHKLLSSKSRQKESKLRTRLITNTFGWGNKSVLNLNGSLSYVIRRSNYPYPSLG